MFYRVFPVARGCNSLGYWVGNNFVFYIYRRDIGYIVVVGYVVIGYVVIVTIDLGLRRGGCRGGRGGCKLVTVLITISIVRSRIVINIDSGYTVKKEKRLAGYMLYCKKTIDVRILLIRFSFVELWCFVALVLLVVLVWRCAKMAHFTIFQNLGIGYSGHPGHFAWA